MSNSKKYTKLNGVHTIVRQERRRFERSPEKTTVKTELLDILKGRISDVIESDITKGMYRVEIKLEFHQRIENGIKELVSENEHTMLLSKDKLSELIVWRQCRLVGRTHEEEDEIQDIVDIDIY